MTRRTSRGLWVYLLGAVSAMLLLFNADRAEAETYAVVVNAANDEKGGKDALQNLVKQLYLRNRATWSKKMQKLAS